jgi:WD40 repeat protein
VGLRHGKLPTRFHEEPKGEGAVELWDPKAVKRKTVLTDTESEIDQVAFSPSGRYLATSRANQTVAVWDLRANKKVGRFGDHIFSTFLCSFAFSPDEEQLAATSIADKVYLFHVPSGQRDGHLRWLGGPLAYSPKGESIAVGSQNLIAVFNSRKGNLVKAFQLERGDDACSISFSPDGKRIACGTVFGSVVIRESPAK